MRNTESRTGMYFLHHTNQSNPLLQQATISYNPFYKFITEVSNILQQQAEMNQLRSQVYWCQDLAIAAATAFLTHVAGEALFCLAATRCNIGPLPPECCQNSPASQAGFTIFMGQIQPMGMQIADLWHIKICLTTCQVLLFRNFTCVIENYTSPF